MMHYVELFKIQETKKKTEMKFSLSFKLLLDVRQTSK